MSVMNVDAKTPTFGKQTPALFQEGLSKEGKVGLTSENKNEKVTRHSNSLKVKAPRDYFHGDRKRHLTKSTIASDETLRELRVERNSQPSQLWRAPQTPREGDSRMLSPETRKQAGPSGPKPPALRCPGRPARAGARAATSRPGGPARRFGGVRPAGTALGDPPAGQQARSWSEFSRAAGDEHQDMKTHRPSVHWQPAAGKEAFYTDLAMPQTCELHGDKLDATGARPED